MSVPKLGTYSAPPENGKIQYEFTITQANPEIGDLQGTYHSLGSLAGEIKSPLAERDGRALQPERSSSYSWIARVEHGVRINQPPFLIRIVELGSRVEDKEFQKSQHTWTGIYLSGDTILMMGVESFVAFDSAGNPLKSEVRELGKRTFTLSRSEPAA